MNEHGVDFLIARAKERVEKLEKLKALKEEVSALEAELNLVKTTTIPFNPIAPGQTPPLPSPNYTPYYPYIRTLTGSIF